MKHLFNSKIDILGKSIVVDDYGTEQVEEFIKYIDEPCRINFLKENQQVINNKLTKPIELKAYTRVINIENGDLLIYNNKRYNIIDFQDVDGLGQYMIIYASKSEKQ